MRGNPEQSGNADILLYNINNIYNIIFPTVEKTWRKMCNIRVQNHGGIAVVSKRDFDNVTYMYSYNIHAS